MGAAGHINADSRLGKWHFGKRLLDGLGTATLRRFALRAVRLQQFIVVQCPFCVEHPENAVQTILITQASEANGGPVLVDSLHN